MLGFEQLSKQIIEDTHFWWSVDFFSLKNRGVFLSTNPIGFAGKIDEVFWFLKVDSKCETDSQ